MTSETFEPQDDFDRALDEAFPDGLPGARGGSTKGQRDALKALIRLACEDERGDDSEIGSHPFDSTREFLELAREAFPGEDFDENRLLSLREAIGLICEEVEQSQRSSYGGAEGAYGTPPKRDRNGRKPRRGPSIVAVLVPHAKRRDKRH